MEETNMSRIVMVHMALPQHSNTRSVDELYALFRERAYAKSRFKDPKKHAPVMILNLSDGDRNYQMGVPIEQGSFIADGEVLDEGTVEYGFEVTLAGNILGEKWKLHVRKNGQAYLRKQK